VWITPTIVVPAKAGTQDYHFIARAGFPLAGMTVSDPREAAIEDLSARMAGAALRRVLASHCDETGKSGAMPALPPQL
jgi:hypothetical protein